MYLTIFISDIINAVNKLSQFMSHPWTTHLTTLHQILQYLKFTPGQGILFPTALDTKLTTFVDVDWG
uniref:Copia protein n=1 Tax=Cajanus cajan TaxID=3821 RepID=A0A151SEM8_CAJCA|nr:hypothetical protein KK1_024814 [Cajanus cajan]